MIETQLFNPRKRRTIEPPTPQSESSSRVFKKQKHIGTSQCENAGSFWEDLSIIYLTRRALREVDRRNAQAAPCSQSSIPRPQQPLTRSAFRKVQARYQPLVTATKYLGECEPVTLKSIKRIARHGGLDLSDIRDSSHPSVVLAHRMSSSRSSSRAPKSRSASASWTKSSYTTNTKSSGPYDRNFQQHLIDYCVYPAEYEYYDGKIAPAPSNLEEIAEQLERPRASLSPSIFTEEEFRKFKRADAHAAKEKQVTTSVIPIIEGAVGDAKCVSGGIPFTNLAPLTDGTLKPGNPDIYYGARPEQLNRELRIELSAQIVPSTQEDLPIAPNFFVAAKGPDGSAAVAKRQASYDGALGARGIQSLRSYGLQDPFNDNSAHTITSTYHDGQLKMYTMHLTESSNSSERPECHMTLLDTWGMTGNVKSFRKGAAAYRNARDFAKKHRDQVIERANEQHNKNRAQTILALPGSTQTSTSNVHARCTPIEGCESHETTGLVANSRACRTPPPEPGACSQPSKRSNGQVKQLSPLQRKRHNPGETADRRSQSPDAAIIETSGLSQQFEEHFLRQEPSSQAADESEITS